MPEPPSPRSAALADDFERANAEVVAFASGCSAEEWRVVVPGEEWTVGVVVHHVAEGHALMSRWLSDMRAGTGVRESAADVDAQNVLHAQSAAEVTAADTVELLERNGRALSGALRSLTDAQLDAAAPFGPAGGELLPTAAVAAVAARHAREHLGHARSALGAR